ncbi:hypothetical protein FJ251_12480 [bacterium]|nr:hypothetical protein [bacterium]
MRRLAVLVCLLCLPALALATAPAPDPTQDAGADWSLWLEGGPGTRVMPPSLAPFNYLREFDQIVEFLAIWQVSDQGSPNYGGEIEAEAGPLGGVIQTDNTLESIWTWARYKQITGSTAYDGNMTAAWVYSTNYPAWLEEGAAGDNYYRVHNCAWGLTAVLMYKAATGDASYDGYAETCAQYIVANPLVIDGTVWAQRLDAFCKGWAAGNLYLYGQAVGNASYMNAAVTQGTDVYNYLNASPSTRLSEEYWAMSSGTALWGVCNSLFKSNPALGQSWLATNGGYLQIWQDWYNVPGYDWDASWNVAYGNAHFAVWEITGDVTYWNNAKFVMDALLSYDTDDDGGILAESMDPVTEDMTWVTNYLCKFGVDRLLGPVYADDTGVLRFLGLEDGDQFGADEAVSIVILATNYGLDAQAGVSVEIEGGWGSGSWSRNLPFAAIDTLVVDGAWLPPAPGSYTLTARTVLAGDENPANDEVSITIHHNWPVAVPETDAFARAPRVLVNPFRAETGLSFALAAPATLRLEIFDCAGRRVATPVAGQRASGEQRLAWDGRDDGGRPLPAGLYLYRLAAGEGLHAGKLVKLR